MEKTKRTHNKLRTRIHVLGDAKTPRLAVYRSSKHIYAQLIDDQSDKVLVTVSDLKTEGKSTKTNKALAVGKDIASKAKELKIKSVRFDRGGFLYHGRVRAVAEAARENGLQF